MIEKEFSIRTDPSDSGIRAGVLDGYLTFIGRRYELAENKKFADLFFAWKNFISAGLFVDQRVNIPEGLTEGVVAKDILGVYRYIEVVSNTHGKSKFDCYDSINNKIIEVKGCSIPNDLSSWSPKPYFDVLYFVDFSTRDGKYKIFRIDTTSEELKNEKVSATETFQQQIDDSRRPRFSIYDKYINPSYKCSGKPIFQDDLNNYL